MRGDGVIPVLMTGRIKSCAVMSWISEGEPVDDEKMICQIDR